MHCLVLRQCLTSESGPGNNRAAMISPIKKSLETRAAVGFHSLSWSYLLLGQYLAQANTIES